MSRTHLETLQAVQTHYRTLKHEISKVIVGQQAVIDDILTCIFSGGHALLIGVPGLAKTLLVNSIAQAMDLKYRRIQFTPDLMPGDIIGSEVLDQQRQFQFIQGPVFANIILADEINRTPPKTQAALLEAMQERAVTVAGETRALPQPFFVLATQNPIEQEGTYPLPEAQLDRFMFNIWVDYPSVEEELEVVRRTTQDNEQSISKILSASDILSIQQAIRAMPVAENVLRYAVDKVVQTRPLHPAANEMAKKYLQWGAGPRASQYLILGAKTHAALNGTLSPNCDDVDAVLLQVLRHRIVRNYRAEADQVTIEAILGLKK